MKADIFYAIDMGAPSGEYSGFYCWRYDPQTGFLKEYDGKLGGWYSCMNDIRTDSSVANVHLTIEAALWGMKDENEHWMVRFGLKDHPHYTERPWYSGAGASTGLMAQEFLHQLVEKPMSTITVRESYISGLKYNKKQKRGENKNHIKPTETVVCNKNFKSAHAHDAFEGLLLTLEEAKFNVSAMKFTHGVIPIDISSWVNWTSNKKQEIKVYESTKCFGIGVLGRNCIFNFEPGKILFTKREFTKLED